MSRMQQNIYESSRLRSAHAKTSKRQRRSLQVQGMRTCKQFNWPPKLWILNKPLFTTAEHANEVYARQPHLNAPAPPPKSGRKFHLCQVRQRLSQLEFIGPPCYIAQKDNQKLSLQVQVVWNGMTNFLKLKKYDNKTHFQTYVSLQALVKHRLVSHPGDDFDQESTIVTELPPEDALGAAATVELKCPECDKTYTDRGKLRVHLNKHNNIRAGRFQCRHCGRVC